MKLSTPIAAAALGLAALTCVSCVTRHSLVTDPVPTALTPYDANYTETALRAVQYMLWNARDKIIGDDAFDTTRPVLCAVTVNPNAFHDTSNFGRLMGQSLKTALQSQRANKIIEIDLRQQWLPIFGNGAGSKEKSVGEFFLSRDVALLAKHFNSGAVLVSTYSVALNKVYVQVELINTDQNVIVAAHQFDIPIGPRTWALLTDKELPPEADQILRYKAPAAATENFSKPWPFTSGQ